MIESSKHNEENAVGGGTWEVGGWELGGGRWEVEISSNRPEHKACNS